MLETMGVTVVQAKAEGEALCALLNMRGIVDGVISNDGDCLVFGAKVVYTRFSIENLDNSQVIRYNADKLFAKIRATDAEDVTTSEIGTVPLSRKDLISFALLTGSDLAGAGLTNVGYFKAVRFIRKCQLDNPLRLETASLAELESWENLARETTVRQVDDAYNGLEELKEKVATCCSRCCHKGNKRSHEKHGCAECGTQPGEPCFLVTADDRFRRHLRAKALAVGPSFEPRYVVSAYMKPNENQLPVKLSGATSASIPLEAPNLNKLLEMKLIVKGRSYEVSREYLRSSVGRLLSRLDLLRLCHDSKRVSGEKTSSFRFSGSRPEPLRIVKAVTRNHVPSFEVEWKVNATVTDEDGEGVDGYEYSTIEPRDLISNGYPQLVKDFEETQKEKRRQGEGEQQRRREFLRTLWIDVDVPPCPEQQGDDAKSPGKRREQSKKQRKAFFQKRQRIRPGTFALKNRKRVRHGGQDAGLLMRLRGKLATTSSVRPGKTTPFKFFLFKSGVPPEKGNEYFPLVAEKDPCIPKTISIPVRVDLATSPPKTKHPIHSPSKAQLFDSPPASPKQTSPKDCGGSGSEKLQAKTKRRFFSPAKKQLFDSPRPSPKQMSPNDGGGNGSGSEKSPPKARRRFFSPAKKQLNFDTSKASPSNRSLNLDFEPNMLPPKIHCEPNMLPPKIQFYSPPKMQLCFDPSSPNLDSSDYPRAYPKYWIDHDCEAGNAGPFHGMEEPGASPKNTSNYLDRDNDKSPPKARFCSPPKQLGFGRARALYKPMRLNLDCESKKSPQNIRSYPPPKLHFRFGSRREPCKSTRPNLGWEKAKQRKARFHSPPKLNLFRASPRAYPTNKRADHDYETSSIEPLYGEEATFCHLGGFVVEVSPIRTQRRTFF